MLNFHKLILSFFSFIPVIVFAQNETTLWFHELGKEEGLTANNITSVFVDSEGLTWIASVEGLFKFDGRMIKQYPSSFSDSAALSENHITSNFFEDAQKNIWFCTNMFVHSYNRKNDNFSRFKLLDHNNLPINEGYNAIYLERDSFLWLQAGNKELFRYNIHKGNQSKPLGQLTFDVKATPGFSSKGELKYIFSMDATKSVGLEIFEHDGYGNLFKKPIYFDGNTSSIPSLFISNVLFESDTSVWLAAKSGIYKWSFKNGRLPEKYINCNSMTSIAPFGPNQFIVSEFGVGLSLVDKINKSFSRLKTRSLNNPNVDLSSFLIVPYFDDFGNLWLTIGGGIAYTYPEKIKFGTIHKMPLFDGSYNYNFRTIVQDDKKNIWCSTYNEGILLLNKDGNLLRHYHPDNPKFNSLFDGRVNHTMLDASQNLWVATVTGVAIFSTLTNKFKPVYDINGKLVNDVVYIYQMKNGDILASTLQNGIYRAFEENNQWQLTKIFLPKDGSDFYIEIYEDSLGTVYIAHNFVELLVFDYFEGRLENIESLPISGFIRGFYEDGNKLWVATSNGLVGMDKTNLKSEPVFYNENYGLLNKNIQSIIADDERNLWLGTTKGIVKFQVSDTSFYHFSLADGVQSESFYEYATLKHKDGSLWFGGNNGITIVRPESIEFVKNVPKIQITNIKINDERPSGLADELIGASNINMIRNLRMSYNENTLSFDFIAIDYGDPKATRLEYFMEGEDNNWVSLERGETGFARYSNLSPGEYTFKVRAYNSDGSWGYREIYDEYHNRSSLVFTLVGYSFLHFNYWWDDLCLLSFPDRSNPKRRSFQTKRSGVQTTRRGNRNCRAPSSNEPAFYFQQYEFDQQLYFTKGYRYGERLFASLCEVDADDPQICGETIDCHF